MKAPNPMIIDARAEQTDSEGRTLSILSFEPARQDRRLYYRLLINGKGAGSLTDEKHALETIDYWRAKGWLL